MAKTNIYREKLISLWQKLTSREELAKLWQNLTHKRETGNVIAKIHTLVEID